MFDRHNVGTWPATVNLEFVNREAELKDLDAVAAKGGVLALYGRRRVGKTRCWWSG